MQLKQSSGVDIQLKISDVVEKQKRTVSIADALNDVNMENYLYPSRYNDAHEMIRYFDFTFIEEEVAYKQDVLHEMMYKTAADGVIFGVLPSSADAIKELHRKVLSISSEFKRAVFVLPKSYFDVEAAVRDFKAVIQLKEQANGDRVLFDEYEVVYEDLRDLMVSFISSFTHPEQYQAYYISDGIEQTINRKAAFSELLSSICDLHYSKTPVINNEALNRNEATSMARNSRNKIVAALLRSELEPNLGLTGTGQEVSIMRSTLLRTGVLKNENGNISVNLHPECNPRMADMLSEIEDCIVEA